MEDIVEILKQKTVGKTLTVCGWVRTKRETKNAIFIELNDGTCMSNLQCVFNTSDAAQLEAAL
ncbi:MAG TPA: OB-fold nucleic acid binding domain-containing protein, partial [Spirochaetales bacterium]|nr:OB-fold nucleic acid binding domain-containing protein [Spirochaetales bacterium]